MKDLVGYDANVLKIPLLHLCYAIALTLRRGSSALAHTLRYPCATLALLLTFGIGQVFAANRTYDGSTYIFWNLSPTGANWWNDSGRAHKIQFQNTDNSWTELVSPSWIEGKLACYLVPSGTYKAVKLNSNWNNGGAINNTGSIEFDSDASKDYISNFSENSTTATWSKIDKFTFSEDAVLYFTITNDWWNNSNCFHYAKFENINGTYTSFLPAYNLSSYTTNNSAPLSTASTGKEDVFFVTVSSGTYLWCNFERKSSDSPTGGTWGGNTTNDILLSIEHNKGGTIQNASSSITWTTDETPSSTCALEASVALVALNDPVTLTPSLTSNALLNTIQSVEYNVSSGVSGTDWTIVGNTFTPLRAGSYTISANVTYNAKGFPSLTTTTTASNTVTITASSDLFVTYNGNGSTGGSVPVDASTYESGNTVTILGNTGNLVKSGGYVFEGWTDNSAGTGTVYKAGDSYTITSTTTFYAKWADYSNTFYYVDTEFWGEDSVYLYHWGGTNGEFLGTWPGTKLDYISEVIIDGHSFSYYGVGSGIASTNYDGNYIINNGTGSEAKKQTQDIGSINTHFVQYYVPNTCYGRNAVTKPSGTWYSPETVGSATIGCPALLPFADINEITLSTNRIPPMASITATPSMTRKGTGDKAYCWKLFSDAACTAEVAASFASVGDGAVSFLAPATRGTYYLRLQVHSDDGCASTLDDEEVVSFEVTTTDMVFFRNVPNWGSVHVYFLGTTDYWDNDNGTGCSGRDNGIAHGMTRIENTNIYYYDYHGNSNVVFNPSGAAYIAFTDNYLPNAGNFSGCQAVYRADFSACAPMYVPENYISEYKNTSAGNGQAAYYNRGYWTNYMSTASGFTLHIYDGKTKNQGNEITSQALTAASIGDNTYSFTYNFASADKTVPYTYGFEVSGCGGAWYAVDADMNINNCTNWNLFTGTTSRGGVDINANVAHTFVLTLTRDGHIQLSVDYPPSEGDYRLLYDDNTQAPHPSQVIRKCADGKDTVAMYIRPSAAGSTLKVQSVSLSPSITWRDYATIDISGLRDSVYLFYLEQDGSGALSVNTSETKPYVGPYYIRTQSVDGGWDSYRNSPDNLMTYSQWSADQRYGFNYYKTKWVSPAGSFVTFTIACDYSEALCDTMFADPVNQPLSAEQAQNLPQAANIRFGWNSQTNRLSRAYISGSSNVSDRFLVLVGDDDGKLRDKDGNILSGVNKIPGLNDYEMNFTDLGNWIYRADIKAVPGAQVRLTADYNDRIQYFIGTAVKPETIIGGEGGTPQPMRVTYDFKTNRLTTAWLPDGEEITDNITLKADMMLVRKGQEAATQIQFNGGSISEVKTIYGVMEFKKSEIAGQFPNWSATNAYAYLMYYVSFPFDVRVRDIFGAGTMGENWIIQKYNGAKRASIGWFAETSTFWETLPADSVLHKHEGYLLLLDRISFNDETSDLWYKIPSSGSIYLYFPSASNTIGTIQNSETAYVDVPSHVCSIDRTFTVDGVAGTLSHKNTDSHWNVIGTPLLENANAYSIGAPTAGGGDETLNYYYAWNSADNTLAVKATLNNEGSPQFKSMHSYMVQYAGRITFHGSAITPAAISARRLVQNEPNYRVELQLVSEDNNTSRTYVELRENACDTFALNEDMYMMRSSRTVDLYSFAGSYDVAANVLSLANHTVPIGLDVKRAGTYRFKMPSSFNGTVILLDKTTGERTNLALSDYEVYLESGMNHTRFELILSVSMITTTIESVGEQTDGQVRKYLQNGQLFILKEGVVYDARGNKVK